MQLYFRRRYLVPPGDGVLRKAVQAERQPYSGALLQHLEAQPVGLNKLGLHIRHPAYRPDPTIARRRHRPADQWRSERRRDPCTFRLGCHAPLCLTADAERPPEEEIMSIGGAHGARRGTGPTYLDCPLSRGALYLILQNRISRGSGSPEIKRIAAVADERGRLPAATPAKNPRHRARAARPLSNGRSIAVGMPIAGHPPRRSGRAQFEHPAPTLGV